MSSAVYPKALDAIGKKLIDLTTDDIRVMLLKAAYTYDPTDEFIADIGANDNGRSAAAIGGRTMASGVLDGSDTSLTATGAVSCDAVLVFLHTGSDATARLLARLEGSAFTPAASQPINVLFHASGILSI